MGDQEKKKRVQVNPNAPHTAATHFFSVPPTLKEEAKTYTPFVYTFRVKTRGKITKLKNITAKSPPFYVLFDHTLAVIWTLFNHTTDKKLLGIVQLQWALYFLQSIYNSEGVHPKDVQLCIDTIQDYLISEYAEISEESVIYSSDRFEGPADKEVPEPPPFSVNYVQMIDKCPTPTISESPSEIFDREILDELENVKHIVGIESVDLTKVASKEQVMEVLTDMQKEQIEKITKELKMLYVVEDMMKNTDTDNFQGFTDEKQFESLFKKNA